jgi:hypothetical protein
VEIPNSFLVACNLGDLLLPHHHVKENLKI